MALENYPVFNKQSVAELYTSVRPSYDNADLEKHIQEFLSVHFKEPFENAADIGCGTGISTRFLAPKFKHVLGLDISATQVEEAKKVTSATNVEYGVSRAEDLSVIPSGSLQLVTVGTAVHYFDCKIFFREVDRVLLPGGCLAQYGYNNYYTEPKNLKFGNHNEKLTAEVSKKCNDIIIEMFNTIRNQKKYKVCMVKEVGGVTPPYKEIVSHVDHSTFEEEHNLDSLLAYFRSLGQWQTYCDETSTNGEELSDSYQKRLTDILKGVTDKPETLKFHLRFTLFLLLARKPIN